MGMLIKSQKVMVATSESIDRWYCIFEKRGETCTDENDYVRLLLTEMVENKHFYLGYNC